MPYIKRPLFCHNYMLLGAYDELNQDSIVSVTCTQICKIVY